MRFYQKLEQAIVQNTSYLCIGLDPVEERLPQSIRGKKNPTLAFLLQIIEFTQTSVAAYKPNFAYFEALGPKGMETLSQVIAAIPPGIVIIGDAKRGDIGHSAQMYAKAVFETYRCDAVTVNPYQGYDALQPFFECEEKGTFVLCLTSNPGSRDFQIPGDLYLRVAEKVKVWNTRGNCGMVVGATQSEWLQTIRQTSGPMPYLIPGIGAQGGDLEKTIQFAEDDTAFPYLINTSRAVLYASSEENFAQSAGKVAQEWKEQINSFRTANQNLKVP